MPSRNVKMDMEKAKARCKGLLLSLVFSVANATKFQGALASLVLVRGRVLYLGKKERRGKERNGYLLPKNAKKQ